MFQEVKPRPPQTIMLAGASGSGKTHTALKLARALAGDNGIIAAIDVGERESMVGYGMEKGLEARYIIIPANPYGWETNTTLQAIKYAKKHADVLVLDSLTNVWQTILTYKELVLDKPRNGTTPNKYTAWAESGKTWNSILSALRGDKPAIITTRSKMSHVMEKNEKGINKVIPIGLQPILRPDTEYEFDIWCNMDGRILSVVQPRHHMALAGLVLPEPTIDDLKIFRYELEVTHGKED